MKTMLKPLQESQTQERISLSADALNFYSVGRRGLDLH